MNIIGRAAEFSRPRWGVPTLISLLGLALFLAIWPQSVSARQDAPAPPPGGPQAEQAPTEQTPPYTQSTPEQLQQLVAPIALYPDSLVAQILAASTFPEQVVQADRWVQEHQDLKGDALGQAVDQQPWDPSVKALTAFPFVLGNMDTKGGGAEQHGAGDAMVAAFAYGEITHLSFRESFRLAMAASAASVTMEGTKFADLAAIKRLLREVHVEDLSKG